MRERGDDGAGRSEHRLVVIRRAARDDREVLLLKTGNGWSLPSIELPEQRSADVTDLNRAARTALGLETSVLRCLADEPGEGRGPRRHLHAMEAHADAGPMPAGGRWMRPEAACAAMPPNADARRSIESWIHRAAEATSGAAACDWSRVGWRDEVLAWVGRQLDRRRWPPVSAITQVRVWEFSQVLYLETAAGNFYFKSRPESGAREAVVTSGLAARHPVSMPDVVAIEPGRGWLLMRATAGADLMEVGDLDGWTAAAATLADMQIDWVGAGEELAALGCPRRSLVDLEAEIGPLVADVALLQPERADRLGDAEVADLGRRRGELEALCRELDGFGVPPSLEHGDLWGANVIAAEGASVLIDWENASVAHPFFTPALLRLSLDYTPALDHVPDARSRIRDAYLGRWADRGPLAGQSPRRLEEAFDLAERVAMVHYAAQFRHSVRLVDTSWEVRSFVPMFLRRLLAR